MVVDIETYDPLLREKGPGVYREDGYILGVGIYEVGSVKKYFSLAHPGTSKEESDRNREEIAALLATDSVKVTANGLYDLDWLVNGYGFKVNGVWEDVCTRECLLDAHAYSYSVDTMSKKYGSGGKREDGLTRIVCAKGCKITPRTPVQTYLYMCTAEEIQEYIMGDLEETQLIYDMQQPLLEMQNLLPVLQLENELMPLLLKMKKTGARIDEKKRQDVADKLTKEYYELKRKFDTAYNCEGCNINSPSDLVDVFKAIGAPIAYTAKGSPSFNAETLGALEHPIGQEILHLKSYKTVVNNYVNGSLLEYQVKGRIHPCFYPMRRDDGGTVTGRFACIDPNMQQIPSKDEKNGPLIRSIIIPEDDCVIAAPDYSQIEYRLFLHYAVGPGADSVRKLFNDNPKTDYHQFVMDITGLSRKYAKNFNFGTLYFMGKKTMQRKFGFSMEQCEALTTQYFDAMPFVKPTRNKIVAAAKAKGYVRTIMGRRARISEEMLAQEREFIVVNHLIQGSAADVLKLGMRDAYRAGVLDHLPMHLTVHDELVLSVGKEAIHKEAYAELVNIMTHGVKLDVPLLVDSDTGPSWGEVS